MEKVREYLCFGSKPGKWGREIGDTFYYIWEACWPKRDLIGCLLRALGPNKTESKIWIKQCNRWYKTLKQ